MDNPFLPTAQSIRPDRPLEHLFFVKIAAVWGWSSMVFRGALVTFGLSERALNSFSPRPDIVCNGSNDKNTPRVQIDFCFRR